MLVRTGNILLQERVSHLTTFVCGFSAEQGQEAMAAALSPGLCLEFGSRITCAGSPLHVEVSSSMQREGRMKPGLRLSTCCISCRDGLAVLAGLTSEWGTFA